MLHVMQIMTYLLNNREFDESDVIEYFEMLQFNPNCISILEAEVGVEFRNAHQEKRTKSAIDSGKWKSALEVVKMQQELK